jgi:glycerol kinase
VTVLAIDQGTTSTKAYAWTEEGLREAGRRQHRQIRPRPGWVEHDPEELIGHIAELIEGAGAVSAIGLANQGETVIAWDAKTKRPLYNAIVWQDERTSGEVERLRASGIEDVTRERAGLPLDSYFSATKLRWLIDNAEGAGDLIGQGRLRLGTSDAFFLDRLTGVFATDPSTASRTSLMNIHHLAWDPVLCEAFGIPPECLPEIRPTVGDFGRLAAGPSVICSIVDQQASLFGHGCRAPGDIKLTFGTGAFVLGLTEQPRLDALDRGLLPTCAWQTGGGARYALDGGILTAGAAIEWLRRVGLWDDRCAIGSGGFALDRDLIFVPALAGLGSPYWDRAARGAWFGLELGTEKADLCQAVLEGIALRAAEVVDTFSACLGGARRISVDGGLTQNDFFVRFLANALARPVEVASSADVTAIGVLCLCLEGLGLDEPTGLRSHSTVVPDKPLRADQRARFAQAVALARSFAGERR